MAHAGVFRYCACGCVACRFARKIAKLNIRTMSCLDYFRYENDVVFLVFLLMQRATWGLSMQSATWVLLMLCLLILNVGGASKRDAPAFHIPHVRRPFVLLRCCTGAAFRQVIRRHAHSCSFERSSLLTLGMNAGGGDDGWNFVDAKGFNMKSAAVDEMELRVIARPFGAQLVTGDEQWLDMSKASEELLADMAHKQGLRIAYTVGRASTSGAFANSQGFLAGTTASLISVREVRRKAGGGVSSTTVSCLVRVEGRVVLKAVKEMKPTITVVASLLHDVEPETPSRWLYLDKLVSKVVNESSAIQMLRKSTAKKSLQSKLINLEKTAFLANIPDDQYKDLLNKSAAATAERARLSPSQIAAAPAGELDDVPIMQRCQEVCVWLKDSNPSNLKTAYGDGRLLQAEVLSFLALRQGDADAATLASANTMTEAWARLVIAVELLEKKRSRLAALSALSGLG